MTYNPQTIGWEKAVLGTGLFSPASMPEAEHLLPSDFTGCHQIIFAEMMALHRRGSLDTRALTEALRSRNELDGIASFDVERVAGEHYIAELLTYRGASMEEYAAQVMNASLKRQLRQVGALIAADAQDERVSAQEAHDEAERRLLRLRRSRAGDNGVTIGEVIGTFMFRLEGLRSGTIQPAWVPRILALKNSLIYVDQSDYWITAARPGEGKCLGRGTKVVMSDGSLKTVEEIRPGDLLMGTKMLPRRVLSITHGRDMLYWVRQKHGIDYRVNRNHVLSLKSSKDESEQAHAEIRNVSVRQLLNEPKSWPARWKGYKIAVRFPEREVPLAPYFLGLWLGDGAASGSQITSTDPEVIGHLQDYAARRSETLHRHMLSHRLLRTRKGGCVRDGRTVHELLRNMGVFNNKHIPDLYLRNSRRVRLELLAGIVDSAGALIRNRIEITMQNADLGQQIKFLADTLGLRTSPVDRCNARRQAGAERVAYRITIHGDLSACPIRIPRKKPDRSRRCGDWRLTDIRIEQDQVDDYYGFTLDGDGLFLLEDMTVTHNSSLMRFDFGMAAVDDERREATLIVNLENTQTEYAKFIISMCSGIDSNKLKDPRLLNEIELERVRDWATRLASLPFYIVTLAAPSVEQIDRVIRYHVANHGIARAGVDYVQLMNNGKSQITEDVTCSSKGLRAISLRYGIPLLVNSQLSRNIENRGEDAEPKLSDLRDSGSLEQDATIVTVPRALWVNPSSAQLRQFSQNIDPLSGQLYPQVKAIPIVFHVLKNRNGPIGKTEPVLWVKSTNNFIPLTFREPQ